MESSSLVLMTIAPFTARRASRTPRNFFLHLQRKKFMYYPTQLIEFLNPFSKPTSGTTAALSPENPLASSQVIKRWFSLPACLGFDPVNYSPQFLFQTSTIDLISYFPKIKDRKLRKFKAKRVIRRNTQSLWWSQHQIKGQRLSCHNVQASTVKINVAA